MHMDCRAATSLARTGFDGLTTIGGGVVCPPPSDYGDPDAGPLPMVGRGTCSRDGRVQYSGRVHICKGPAACVGSEMASLFFFSASITLFSAPPLIIVTSTPVARGVSGSGRDGNSKWRKRSGKLMSYPDPYPHPTTPGQEVAAIQS